jgi:hypothetical protein
MAKKAAKNQTLKKTLNKIKKSIRPLAPLLEIEQRKGAKGVMVGANTVLKIDGKPVKGATGVTFEVNAKGVAKATVTLIGRFKIKGRPLVRTVKLYK